MSAALIKQDVWTGRLPRAGGEVRWLKKPRGAPQRRPPLHLSPPLGGCSDRSRSVKLPCLRRRPRRQTTFRGGCGSDATVFNQAGAPAAVRNFWSDCDALIRLTGDEPRRPSGRTRILFLPRSAPIPLMHLYHGCLIYLFMYLFIP